MIESRYKIEYAFPDEEKAKKPSSFRFLWYVFSFVLALLMVAAITYNFSLNNLFHDSTVLFEKAKINVLNLGNEEEFKKPEIQKKHFAQNILIPKPKPSPAATEKKAIELSTNSLTLEDSKNKKTITELQTKQELQLKEIQEQITKNTELVRSLDTLRSELVLEKSKNDSLNSKLSEQKQDKIGLQTQLNKIIAESEVSDNEITKDNKNINTKEVQIVNDLDSIESNQILAEPDTNTQTSATDKIVEEIKSIAKEKKTIIKDETTDAKDLAVATESNSTNEKALESIPEKENTKTTDIKNPKVENVIETKKINVTNSEKEQKNTIPETEIQKELVTTESKVKKEVSAIDAIVATMNNSQAEIPNSSTTSSNTDKNTQKQLVETSE